MLYPKLPSDLEQREGRINRFKCLAIRQNVADKYGKADTLGAITGSIAEAFYGIPAVLIAECKSRIDKGLMTDVLDEFDHVLGRSMDTYSDEMDEIQANQMIEAAIDQYYIQQDKNGRISKFQRTPKTF